MMMVFGRMAKATALPMNQAALRRLGHTVGIAFAIMVAGCEKRASEPAMANQTDTRGITLWADPKTGCEYLLMEENYPNLARAAITPRLREDGTVSCPRAQGM